MINNAMSVLFASDSEIHMNELTIHRTSASLPFGGRYRLIDFALSNLVNSGITSIGIVTRNNYNSLMDHIRMGRDWNLNRKNSGIMVFPPFVLNTLREMYKGKIEALYSLRNFMNGQKKAEYVVISNTNIVLNIDLEEIIEEHIAKGSHITMLVKKSNEINPRKNLITMNADNRVTDMRFAVVSSKEEQLVNMNVYIVKKDLLISLVETAYSRGFVDFEKDILLRQLSELKIFCHELTGYAVTIDDIPSYYKHNMELLDTDIRTGLFYGEGAIYTKVKDSVPTRYLNNAKVSNSLIADGCEIDGTVENSILFRGVRVEKGAIVRNSIVMENCFIGEKAVIKYTITDKNVTIQPERQLSGYETYPIVIVKDKTV
ncbi:MAG: glucose-1-phosphate adenylyltransferase subunit GlgD [Clostridia bacterium]